LHVQDPLLFSGTLRVNIDPTSVYDDAQIWSALNKAHLHDVVTAWPDTLQHNMAESGENLRCAK
jgi:ATP-binding cassette subfamily C (CFTR/MRP) protein 1